MVGAHNTTQELAICAHVHLAYSRLLSPALACISHASCICTLARSKSLRCGLERVAPCLGSEWNPGLFSGDFQCFQNGVRPLRGMLASLRLDGTLV